MRVALVSTHAHPIALGLRYVSSYLRAAGHDVTLLLMSSRRDTARPDWSTAALDDFISHVRDCDIVGMSLLTNTFRRASALTQRIRHADLHMPIVWGGTHATVAPDECLQVADAACIGEGEEPLLQLAERMGSGIDPTTIPGLWFAANGPFGNRTVVRNAPGPLETHLDDLPFPDWDLRTQWVADADGMVPAKPGNLRGALDTLRVVTTRGCPYHCTFCNNAALRRIHTDGGQWVRTRSLDNVLDELQQAVAAFPSIRAINFVDDLFFVRKEPEIEAFVQRYNREIGLPLELDAFPNTVTERKVTLLARAPIQLISMGIEAASDDTLRNIYCRPTTLPRIAEAIRTLSAHRVRTEYHYIVSNPFEPDQNVIETMRFIATHHRGPAVLRVFPLMFYPGTPLYERAREAGLVGSQDEATYDHMGTGTLQFARHDYLAVWLRAVLNLRNVGVPRWACHRLIDLVTSRPARWAFDRRWFCPTVFVTYQISRKLVRNLLYQPFVKPFKYLRRRQGRSASGPTTPYEIPSENKAARRRRVAAQATLPRTEVIPQNETGDARHQPIPKPGTIETPPVR